MRLRLRADAVEWREVAGEVVALDLQRSLYLSLNPSGALLWGLIAAGATRLELEAALCEGYAVPAERAGRDVDAFVRALADRDLLDEG